MRVFRHTFPDGSAMFAHFTRDLITLTGPQSSRFEFQFMSEEHSPEAWLIEKGFVEVTPKKPNAFNPRYFLTK